MTVNNCIEGYISVSPEMKLEENVDSENDTEIFQQMVGRLVRIKPVEGRKFSARVIKVNSSGLWLQSREGMMFFINIKEILGLWTLSPLPEKSMNEPADSENRGEVYVQ